MALYTLGDLHLALSVDKPMDIFGGNWKNHVEKIERNFHELVKPHDTVVLGGDISWGINLNEAREDLLFVSRLPGKKIILKGNHDLWWGTLTKMNWFLSEQGIKGISFLYNNAYLYGNIALCGTRGWMFDDDPKPEDQKIFLREVQRLRLSLEAGKKLGARRYFCFLHYPPLTKSFVCEEIVSLMREFGVEMCVYAHLHGESVRHVLTGRHFGIDFHLASGDYLNFWPLLLEK